MRNSELLAMRNQRIRERFNQLYMVDRIRLDDVMEKLVSEFFISDKTITNVLRNHGKEISAKCTDHQGSHRSDI